VIDPSPQQLDIIGAPLSPLCVVACAGSGKTLAAVHRLAAVRDRIRACRGHVALLSFSNVAVGVFNRSYLSQPDPRGVARPSTRICIDTFDGFITTNILRPHGSRTMGCERLPFLVFGGEPFLENKIYKYWATPASGNAFPLPPKDIKDVDVGPFGDEFRFCYRFFDTSIPVFNGPAVTERLGRLGAYTHSTGRYWAYLTLKREAKILSALVRRYPHIIIDEAQDVGSMHRAILGQLASAGAQITLVGDPNQAIFGFCGADGVYLRAYESREDVLAKNLTTNFRSVPAIVAVANSLSGRSDLTHRKTPESATGAFFIAYQPAERSRLILMFQGTLKSGGMLLEKSALVCRAAKRKRELGNYGADYGQGLTKLLASAVIARDSARDYLEAFRIVARCVTALLKNPQQNLYSQLIQSSGPPEVREARKEIWEFTRDAKSGLPPGTLIADVSWHPEMVRRVKGLMARLQAKLGHLAVDNLGQRLKRTALPNVPLVETTGEGSMFQSGLRVETVHGVKGESLDAVLYLADKDHVEALISGTNTEIGRIGYVALTRARNLFWLGVPEDCVGIFREGLLGHGFAEILLEGTQQGANPGG
jgi:hypothetical protein